MDLHNATHIGRASYPLAAGGILWLTGLSGAGKSTLAEALRSRLTIPHEVLDGDQIRAHLAQGLGFSKVDRDTSVRRIGFVARLLARHGILAIAAAISPYAAIRSEIRQLARREGSAFIEVFVNAPLDVLIARDVKGLYRRALNGELTHFTGISDPYEPPSSPDVVVHTERESIEASTDRIMEALTRCGAVPPVGVTTG